MLIGSPPFVGDSLRSSTGISACCSSSRSLVWRLVVVVVAVVLFPAAVARLSLSQREAEPAASELLAAVVALVLGAGGAGVVPATCSISVRVASLARSRRSSVSERIQFEARINCRSCAQRRIAENVAKLLRHQTQQNLAKIESNRIVDF